MIKVICGLIGSGKTTYALKNKKENDIVLDWDLLVEALKTKNPFRIKELQIMMIRFFKDRKEDIWYITTKLTKREKEQLETIKDIEYIWINTTAKQCIENIKKRNRNDEAKHIEEFKTINDGIYKSYYIDSKYINYKIVNVFDSGEKW